MPTTDLLTDVGGEPRLRGARCPSCGTHTFPAQDTCPRCAAAMTGTDLPARGTVWSWTVQRIAPKPPYRGTEPYQPFVVGYVDLGPLRVESRLFGRPVEGWSIDDPVILRTGELHGGYWFEPAGTGG